MGRFHRHDDDYEHQHDHPHDRLTLTESADSVHGDHTSYATGTQRVTILEDIFSENDHLAAHNREAFDAHGVRAINLMSSPGAGKTALLEKTLQAAQGKFKVGIIEGDIETSLDSERLHPWAEQVALLNTAAGFGGECHLDAPMVHHALDRLDLSELDLVIIENVGNLVCPAEFDVGAHLKAMVASVTEGEDKPLKYPVMFRSVDIVVINKIDLLPYLDFDIEEFEKNVRAVNPEAIIVRLSARTGEGLSEWLTWIHERLTPRLTPIPTSAYQTNRVVISSSGVQPCPNLHYQGN